MILPGRAVPPLPLVPCLRRGWMAFRRAPWTFMGFTLVGGAAQLIGQIVQNRSSDALAAEGSPVIPLLLLALAGMTLSLTSGLWLSVGLVRGAWIALAGGRPRLAQLMRWNGAAMGRLLGMALLLLLINLLILVMAGLAAGLLSLIRSELGLLALLAGTAAFLFVAVGQIFHMPLTVAGGLGPLDAFRSGQAASMAQWGRLSLFLLLLALLLLLGLLLLGVGLLAAWPLVICSLSAAYQHVFGADDRAGLLASG